ncbi:outer membrane lipoprotein chaperone LolA [Neisseriaceae bacterium TC5R-5]|nr:outer membrane lipoprotein chaperone LolA [Neisseriaceae bacterium TC5R-5]
MKYLALLLLATTSTLPVNAQAAAIAQLKAFVAASHTLSADFNQVVSNKNKREQASGRLEVSRPGQFRWEYQKPYQQLIIGDGKTLWIYDPELQQVTRKAQGAALGSSPAALLAGNNAIEQNYQLTEAGKTGDIEWLSAAPKHSDNSFSAIRMGFKSNNLVEMALTDSFGNQTQIRFSGLQKNPALNNKRFSFTPPKGVDVVDAD